METVATSETGDSKALGGAEKVSMSNGTEFCWSKRNQNLKYYTLICILDAQRFKVVKQRRTSLKSILGAN